MKKPILTILKPSRYSAQPFFQGVEQKLNESVKVDLQVLQHAIKVMLPV